MSLRDEVRSGVHATLNVVSGEHVAGAAVLGVPLNIVTEVYLDDGAKNYATALATALCNDRTLANGTRDDMAVLITNVMQLANPFSPARLSKPLSVKAKKLVASILEEHGYTATALTNGLSIRDIVKAGISATEEVSVSVTANTRIEVDGVWMESKWYPYERAQTYETDKPWYRLAIRFAGESIRLHNVLAMRGLGINQFIELDEAAHKRANTDQLVTRAILMGAALRG